MHLKAGMKAAVITVCTESDLYTLPCLTVAVVFFESCSGGLNAKFTHNIFSDIYSNLVFHKY